jgi:hypothetical protein
MRIVWLTWYICGVWLLLAVLASAITYAPAGIPHLDVLLPAASGSMALVTGVAAVGLGRLPPTHRVHQSKAIWSVLLADAVTVTLLLVLLG